MTLETSSLPTSAERNSGRARRGLRLLATLPLVLPLVVFASSRGQVAAPAIEPAPASVASVAAAPVPAAAPAVEEAAVSVPAAPAAAVHAVTTRATASFQKARGLSPQVLDSALDAVSCARSRGVAGKADLLTIIDYSLPSTEPRLWVLDLAQGEVLYHELVAHGAGTGDNYATRFSNVPDSRQTSLGLFLTGGTYQGGNGYSLKLQGLDAGINDRAEARHIVMHGAWYVSPEHARGHGRLGRSWGCPAVSEAVAEPMIDTIKGGSFVYSYSGNDASWLKAASSARGGCSAAPSSPMAAATPIAAAVR